MTDTLLHTLKEKLPETWLSDHYQEYLELLEKITYSLIQLKAGEMGWKKKLEEIEEFDEFFASESKRLGYTKDEIKGFFAQIGQSKAKEQVFEKHYADLVPKDEQGRSLIPKSKLEEFVHSYSAKAP